MIPTVFSTAYLLFPRDRQATMSAIVGLVATLAPTLGPTLGGWLTTTFSWHWLFLVNLVPGIVVTVGVLWSSSTSTGPTGRCSKASTASASSPWRRSWAASSSCSTRARTRTGSPTGPCAPGLRHARRGRPLLLARAHPLQPDRRSALLQEPQLRHRQPVQLRAGHRPLWRGLPAAAVPRPGAGTTRPWTSAMSWP